MTQGEEVIQPGQEDLVLEFPENLVLEGYDEDNKSKGDSAQP
jgi:hypothetical protein